MLGNGVSIANIRRANAEFYTAQIRRESAVKSDWESASSALSQMEIIFNEPSDTGMANAMDEFFKSWNDLATEPTSVAARVSVKESADMLCHTFHSMDQSLVELESNINANIESNVFLFNELASRIAELNSEIVQDESSGFGTSGDFRDERDRLLAEMSQIASVEIKEDINGSVDVYLGGENMVHKDEYRELDTFTASGSDSDNLYVVIKGKSNPIKLTGGGLSGLVESRDGYLADTREALDHLAEVFINKVNEVHQLGWTPSGSGFDFFEGSDAGTIGISGAITNNTNLIASSYDGTVGDNSLANDIAALSEANISSEEPMSINDLYQSTVAALGIHSMKAQGMVTNGELILDNLEMRKESITGVSLDEELINLSKFQNSYEAAAKVLNTINELMQTILDM